MKDERAAGYVNGYTAIMRSLSAESGAHKKSGAP
jgi:hypothetical protein